MNTHTVYSSKAEKYARYRWDYAAPALQAIFETAHLSRQSVVADIGAGTGILTRHFAGRVKQVCAVEPNAQMRRAAGAGLRGCPGCAVVAASAEAIPLPAGAVDLITVAQAIHWFEPEASRAEFRRILKPGGWLAVLRNYGAPTALNAAVAGLAIAENGACFAPAPVPQPSRSTPMSFFYGEQPVGRMVFPFACRQSWEAFLGALLSASYMPDENHPLYPRLESAARAVFDRFNAGGEVEVEAATELYLGQPA